MRDARRAGRYVVASDARNTTRRMAPRESRGGANRIVSQVGWRGARRQGANREKLLTSPKIAWVSEVPAYEVRMALPLGGDAGESERQEADGRDPRRNAVAR